MRLLLDTHIWLWALLDHGRLSPAAARAIEDGGNELWLSPISVWECLLFAQRGHVKLDADPNDWVQDALRVFPLRDATMTREVALVSRTIDLPHEDPADRFIAATAAVRDLTLVTADARLLKIAGIKLLT